MLNAAIRCRPLIRAFLRCSARDNFSGCLRCSRRRARAAAVVVSLAVARMAYQCRHSKQKIKQNVEEKEAWTLCQLLTLHKSSGCNTSPIPKRTLPRLPGQSSVHSLVSESHGWSQIQINNKRAKTQPQKRQRAKGLRPLTL